MNSYWNDFENIIKYETLKQDIYTDVCIVGGGITGITTSYLLGKNNISNIILEKDTIASGVSANTTAKITSQHGIFYTYLINTFGKDLAKKYLDSNEQAIRQIENIVNKENIDCDFENQCAYVFTNNKNNVDKIKNEAEIVNSLGLDAKFVTESNLPINLLAAIEFPNQAQFHIRKYLLSLAKKLENSSIYENSKVVDIKKHGKEYIVSTSSRKC